MSGTAHRGGLGSRAQRFGAILAFDAYHCVHIAFNSISRLRYVVSSLREYLAEIGRRGGIKSRRVLAPETARRMVAIREARRAARRLDRSTPPPRLSGTPADTTAAAQAIQDVLQRRLSPAEKLAQVARLTRMVDLLSIEGVRKRHPAATDETIRDLHAALRLGRDLAARVRHAPG